MSANPQNPACDVTIHYVNPSWISDSATLENWTSWLDVQEIARLRKLQNPVHRHRFLVSHALARAVIGNRLQCPPESIVFGCLSQGKPFVSLPQAQHYCHFNLTHTHEMAAIALSSHGPVGIDVEWLERRGPEVGLAQRFFTENEYQDILKQPESEQHRRLLSYWTLKEAYIKAEGWGLSVGLDSFEFALSPNAEPRLHICKPAATPQNVWQFQQFTVLNSHLIAVAMVAPPTGDLRLQTQLWPAF
jgi:4'-phosphopantetheinyl transferase